MMMFGSRVCSGESGEDKINFWVYCFKCLQEFTLFGL